MQTSVTQNPARLDAVRWLGGARQGDGSLWLAAMGAWELKRPSRLDFPKNAFARPLRLLAVIVLFYLICQSLVFADVNRSLQRSLLRLN